MVAGWGGKAWAMRMLEARHRIRQLFDAIDAAQPQGINSRSLLCLQPFQERVRLCSLRKQVFLRLELRRVYAPPAAAQPDWMFQMQHLVIHDVLQYILRHGKMIEDPADNDRIVCRIVVAENAAGPGLAPAHAWARQQSVKEFRVQFLKYYVQVVEVSACRTQALPPAHLADEMGLAHDFMAGDILPIAG